MFLTPGKFRFGINDKFEILVFLKEHLEVLTFLQIQYFYLSFQTFKGTLKMLQITFCSQTQQEKSLK